MGKHAKKHIQFNQSTTKKVKSNEWQQDKRGKKSIYITQFSNEMFKAFYRRQFQVNYFKDDPQEFEIFWDSLSQPLPVSFRVNPTLSGHETLLKKLLNGDLVRSLVSAEQDIDLDSILRPVPWFPGNLAWESKLAKKELRKATELSNLHSYIQKCSSTGLVTRQEMVSMLPPLFLDPQPGEYILDMCAAPGSKTCQLVEAMQLHGQTQHDLGGGCIVANDVDAKRAFMLTHQLQRLPTGNVVITNHGAQFFPTLIKDGVRLQYDKILCDVPCTGDGAARKLPTRWLKWSARDGSVIHPLQLSILMRALTVCKNGGLVLYSTCSLNPAEDEAVVADVFRRAQGESFELVEINGKLEGFRGRRGLTHWPVLATDDLLFKEYGSYRHSEAEAKNLGTQFENDEFFDGLTGQDFVHELKSMGEYPQVQRVMKEGQLGDSKQILKLNGQVRDIRASVFPGSEQFMQQIGIERTMRVLPHDQDTGGFYLALFRKKENIVWGKPQYSEQVLGSLRFKEQEENNIAHQQQEGNQDEDLEINQELLQEILNNSNNEDNDNEDNNKKQNQMQEDKDQEHSNRKERGWQKTKPEEYSKISDMDWKSITEYYGIDPTKIKQEQVLGVGQDNDPIMNPVKKFRYITKETLNLMQYDPQGHLKILSIGCKIFERGKESFGGLVSPYRLCQDALPYIFPFITKRTVECSAQSFFFVVQARNIRENQINDHKLLQSLQNLGNGCFVLYFNQDGASDQIVCQYFRGSVSLMCPQEYSQSFLIRHGIM